jgi:hypothetical protein
MALPFFRRHLLRDYWDAYGAEDYGLENTAVMILEEGGEA